MSPQPHLKPRYILLSIFLGVILYCGIPFLFVGQILREGTKQSNEAEKARIQRILDENPEFAEKYRAWKSGELKLTHEEVEEEIYRYLYPQAYEEQKKSEIEEQE